MNTLLVATRNAGKCREFEVLLADALGSAEVTDIGRWSKELPEVIEDGVTFQHNAIKKALEVSIAAGVSTLADDSGLEVDALEGAPGVFSARFGGEDATDADNNRKLISDLQGVPQSERGARYVAVVVLCAIMDSPMADVIPADIPECDVFKLGEGEWGRKGDRALIWFRGTCEGEIIDVPRGESGFGYDPYFLIPAWGKTMAEVSMEKKNGISHRAKATRLLAAALGRTAV